MAKEKKHDDINHSRCVSCHWNSCRTDYKGEGRRPDGHYNTVGFRIVAEPKTAKENK